MRSLIVSLSWRPRFIEIYLFSVGRSFPRITGAIWYQSVSNWKSCLFPNLQYFHFLLVLMLFYDQQPEYSWRVMLINWREMLSMVVRIISMPTKNCFNRNYMVVIQPLPPPHFHFQKSLSHWLRTWWGSQGWHPPHIPQPGEGQSAPESFINIFQIWEVASQDFIDGGWPWNMWNGKKKTSWSFTWTESRNPEAKVWPPPR